MKDSSIDLPKSPIYSPYTQCYGKTQYKVKRRAIKRAAAYAAESGEVFTVYECPHCKKYHIGGVRH
jgi:hypothetical protein